jgi:S1-C subfamily serine protease
MEHAMMSQGSSSRSKGNAGGFRTRRALPALLVLALAALFAGGLWLAEVGAGPGAQATAPSAAASRPATTPPGASFADLAEKVAPSVVNLTVSKKVKGGSSSMPRSRASSGG